MSKLRVLFIGGTGIISSACAAEAVARGEIELYVLNRGQTGARPLPPGVTRLRADVAEPASVRAAVASLDFDSVVDWIAFTPEQVRADIDLFRGRTGQYVFISSASAYQTPPSRLPVTGGRGSRRRSCGRRIPTTRRSSRSRAAGRCSGGCERESR